MRSLSGSTLPAAPPAHASLLFLLDYIVAKHKSYFTHGPNLVVIQARGAEGVTGREAARMNIGNVSANEEPSKLEGGRHSDRSARAARAEHQIDRFLSGASRAGDVFPAPREREAMFEGATNQYRSAPRLCPVGDADTRVGRNVSELKVRLNNPSPLGECVDNVVNATVVLDRCGSSLKGCFIVIPTRDNG